MAAKPTYEELEQKVIGLEKESRLWRQVEDRPHLTGKDLAGAMLSIRPDIPVILCTGYSDRIDENLAKAMGIGAYVKKPIVFHDIAKIVRQMLDQRN